MSRYTPPACRYPGLNVICGYCWLVKDGSISRFPEWDAYEAASSRLIPWRILIAPFQRTGPGTVQASA